MALAFFHGSIRKKLVGIVLLAALPILILLGFNNVQHESDHVAGAKKDLKIFLHGFSEVQRSITESTKTLLQTVAAMPEIRWVDREEARIILGTLLKANPIYTNVILLDINGNVVAMGKGRDKGFNFADRKQFKEAISTRKFSFGELVVGKATNKSIFPFAMPVSGPDGTPNGAIIIGVSLEHYGELFEASDFPKGAFFGLCDHKGSRLFRTPIDEQAPLGTPIKQQVFEAAKGSGAPGTITITTSDGVDLIVAYEPLRTSKDDPPYMYMFMGLDNELLLKSAHVDLMQGVIISILSVGLAVIIAWGLGRRIIAVKLDRLAAYALAVGKGGTVPPSGEDYSDGELGQLYLSFDTMTARLKRREKELKTATLTAEEANRALRLNMAHLRTLLETMPELVWLKDADGVYVFCNQRFERFFGAKESDIVGKTDYDFVDKELADFFRQNDIAAMNAGKPTMNEETVVYKDDGHVEELETIKTPLVGDDGRFIGVLGVARDITERNRIASELRESEMRFKTLHNASFGGIAIHDKGVIIDCNQGLADVTGYSLEELVGMDGLKLFAEPFREGVMENVISGYEKPYEIYGVRKSGESYPLRLEARNIPYKGKQARVVEFRDITTQRKAEENLRDSELRHRVIFEKSPLGMVRFSDEGRILDCNDRFVELMGSSREELVGFHTGRDSSPEMRDALKEALAGTPSSYEDYYTSVTGKKSTFLHVQFNPVNIGQSPTEVIATLEDFSERKQARDNLQKAKEQAEAFSRSKTEFLTNMSHEIRTPMNGILGMLQLMQTTGLNDEQSGYVRDAMQSSKRLTRLLTDILDLARVEAGKLVIQQQPFDLSEACRQVFELFQLTSEQTGVKLLFDMSSDIPGFVVGDSFRVQQILTNLVGNSFKFTTSGEISLSVYRLQAMPSNGCRILFTVSDTGIGIPDDKLEVLFESFSQVSQGYTREYQGAGLGLAICKQLVELMGGRIAVDSEEGAGTRIYFSLPFGIGEESVKEKQPPEPERTVAARELRILLAEDERVNRLVAQRLLEKAGHRVSVVENGQQAIDAVNTEPFDVVLMDIQMPVMDGVEATRAIRGGAAGEGNASIPIVAITAYAMVGDKEKFLQAGMDGYVDKPVDLNQLYEVLGGLGLDD